MKNFAASALVPVVTQEQLLVRVSELVGTAVKRQLWLMFLDERDVQLPELMPVDIEEAPADRARESFETFIAQVVEAVECSSVIPVLERPGTDVLTQNDRAWFRLIERSVIKAGVILRGPLLSYSDGVGVMQPADFS